MIHRRIVPTFRLVAACATSLLFSSCCIFSVRPPVYEAVTFENGLVVQDLVVPEEGEPIREGDRVTIDYEMRLEDGTEVDSTIENGQPIRFEVGAGQVPAGLDQGILGMFCFGRRRILVPPALAYGAEGRPPRIPPDSVLDLDVEVLRVETGAPEP